MKRISLFFVLCCFFLTLVTACNDEKYELTAYKTLAIASLTYDKTMTAINDLYEQKIVDERVVEKAIFFGKKFTPLYFAAVDALGKFVESNDDTLLANAKTSIKAAIASLDELKEFAATFKVDVTKEAESMVTTSNAKAIVEGK